MHEKAQRAHFISCFPKITATAVGQTVQTAQLKFLVQGSDDLVDEAPSGAFVWKASSRTASCGFSMKGAVLLGTVPDVAAAGPAAAAAASQQGLEFVLHNNSKGSLMGTLLPGDLDGFSLPASKPTVLQGVVVSQYMRIPEVHLTLRDTRFFNILHPEPLMPSIMFSYSISQLDGSQQVLDKRFSGIDCKISSPDRTGDLLCAGGPADVVVPEVKGIILPGTGRHQLELQLLQKMTGGAVKVLNKVTEQFEVEQTPEVEQLEWDVSPHICIDDSVKVKGNITAGSGLPDGIRFRLRLMNGKLASPELYTNISAMLTTAPAGREQSAIRLHAVYSSSSTNFADLRFEDANRVFERAGSYDLEIKYKESRQEVLDYKPHCSQQRLCHARRFLVVTADAGSPSLKCFSSTFFADNKEHRLVTSSSNLAAAARSRRTASSSSVARVILQDAYGNSLKLDPEPHITVSIEAAAGAELPNGFQLPQLSGSTVQLRLGRASFSALQVIEGTGINQHLPAKSPDLQLRFRVDGRPGVQPLDCVFVFSDLHSLTEREGRLTQQSRHLSQQLSKARDAHAATVQEIQSLKREIAKQHDSLMTHTAAVQQHLSDAATAQQPQSDGCYSQEQVQVSSQKLKQLLEQDEQQRYIVPVAKLSSPQLDALKLQFPGRVIGQVCDLLFIKDSVADAAAVAAALSAFSPSNIATVVVTDPEAAAAAARALPQLQRWNVGLVFGSQGSLRPVRHMPHKPGASGNPRRAVDLVSIRADLLPRHMQAAADRIVQELLRDVIVVNDRVSGVEYQQQYFTSRPTILTLDKFLFWELGMEKTVAQSPSHSIGVCCSQKLAAIAAHKQCLETVRSATSAAQELQTQKEKLQQLEKQQAVQGGKLQHVEQQWNSTCQELKAIEEEKGEQQPEEQVAEHGSCKRPAVSQAAGSSKKAARGAPIKLEQMQMCAAATDQIVTPGKSAGENSLYNLARTRGEARQLQWLAAQATPATPDIPYSTPGGAPRKRLRDGVGRVTTAAAAAAGMH